jgi:hypothetical protein
MWPSNDPLFSLITNLNARKMRGTGEAVMKKSAIIAARKLPRIGYIVFICGALLGSVAATAPAQSADLYPYPQYPQYPQYTAYPGYNGYRNCHPCGCRPCCNPCGYRPYVRPAPVVERHWDYWERRYPYRHPYYPNGYAGGYPSYPNGYGGGYPSYPDGYAGGYPSYPGGYAGGARPHLGFGGVYQYPQSPVSYEYGAPPQSPYEYEASARPAYDYDASPRPPVGIPGGYYNAGYVQ